MTVAELIAFLQTQDQEAEVQVLKGTIGRSWAPDSYEFVTLTPELIDYTDLRGNPHIKPDAPYHDKRYLELGERA